MQASPIFLCGYAPGYIECPKCPIKSNCPNRNTGWQQEKKWDRRG